MPLPQHHPMKRLSPDKRNKLIMVLLGTFAVIGAIYFLLIEPQNAENQKVAGKIVSEQARLEQIEKTIKTADLTAQTAATNAVLLKAAEKDVASGDLFAWTYDTMRRFKSDYPLDIPTISQPTVSEVDLIPNFPYKQIKFSLVGTGYYHDIGKFIADLENKFPHMRVDNLTIDSGGGPNGASEKLSFRIEVAALVKSNS
jgi:Tfp pilus assembly protein PilO